jgi:hypothetical protein
MVAAVAISKSFLFTQNGEKEASNVIRTHRWHEVVVDLRTGIAVQ